VGAPGRPSLARLLGSLAYQQTLLGDRRRNRAFHRALAARVRPGQTVLDLGSGTGVWAVAAARLGARRVVAVEREAVLVPVIEALARENGVADRVEVVQADARRVRLPRAFDVVVSEMVGNEAFEEGLLPVLERARRLFLRKGGALVPEWVALAAAPVRAPVSLGLSPPLLEAQRRRCRPRPRNTPADLVPLAPGRELLDRLTRRARLCLPRAGPVRVRDGRSVGGIAVWVEMGSPRRPSTRRTHWPLSAGRPARGPGPPRVAIDWTPTVSAVHAVRGDRGARHASDHAPLFAWGAVRPAIPGR
jgi:SAM-dependent methyltransferase